MPGVLLCDTVCLSHFSAIGRLDVCETRFADFEKPLWTEAVRDEVSVGAGYGDSGCQALLEAAWLGVPSTIEGTGDSKELMSIWVGLNDGRRPPEKHLGEAQCIFLAEKLEGRVLTDDNAAHDFARRRLGPGRVIDTVDLLRESVAMDEIKAVDAKQIAEAIVAAGRFLRHPHVAPFAADYFST